MKKACVTLVFLFFFFHNNTVFAQPEQQSVVLVLAPELSFQEAKWFEQFGEKGELWGAASMAAVNSKPDGPYSYLNNAVSLSMGTRGLGIQGWNAFEHGEQVNGVNVEDKMLQWHGTYPQEGLLHPFYSLLVEKNRGSTYGGEVGLLGENLKTYGVYRFVMGHSDVSEEELIRYGSLFTVDKQGQSPGVLTSIVNEDIHVPGGQSIDSDKVMDKLTQLEMEHNQLFTVVEWGDIQRLFAEKQWISEEQFRKHYEYSLRELERLLHRLVEKDRVVMLLSPMVHEEAYSEKQRLAPFWLWSNTGQHVLTSNTTRQMNIISNMDIAPTILTAFQIPVDKKMVGHPVEKVADRSFSYSQLEQEVDLAVTVFQSRGVVLSSYITLLTIMLVAICILLWKKATQNVWISAAKMVLLSATSSPLWFLLTARWLTVMEVGYYFWAISLLSIATGYLLARFFENPIVVVACAHFIFISIDLLFGNPLMQRSYLGYDAVIGARYYGIGNEYAGVYIVAALLLLTPFLRTSTLWIKVSGVLLMFFTLMLFLGFSNLGTNAGATLAAGVAFGYLVWQWFPKTKVRYLLIGMAGVFLLSLLGLYALQKTGNTTHIGYAFERLLSGDIQYITDVIKRKAAMNWKIFKFSNWTQLFVTSYLLIGVVLWRQKRIVTNEANKLILQTGIVASVALLLLNDSGVVAAATSMFMLVSISYYWMLEKKPDRI
ncbi:hypothetical protein [Bacillus alkalicellulosilyticus]|uniref:hypothetical protein n=1 Tax=Alkalihalobacterium alkalicellulosilyticum TaxID=1912214 RepID=UPI000998B15D|nr:hypothetical protein [Bacillus alkalicellulosilyticus]